MTANNQKVIDLIKPAVCHVTMGRAITQLALTMGPYGITVIDQPPVKEVPDRRKNAPANTLDKLEQEARNNGTSDLFRIKCFLDENVDDYPTYKNSDAFVAEEDAPDPIIEEGDGGFVA